MSFLFESYFQRRSVSFRECKCWFVNLFDCSTDVLRLWRNGKKSLWWRESSFAFYWSQAPGVPSLDPGSAMSAMSAMGGAKMSNLAAQFGCGGGCRDEQWLMERKSREQNSTDHIFYSHLFRPQVFLDLVFFCAPFPSFDANNQATVNCTWWFRFQENPKTSPINLFGSPTQLISAQYNNT